MIKRNEEDKVDTFNLKKTFAKNTQGIGKLFHEVLLIMKFLKTKPQDKSMDIKSYDLPYNVKIFLTEEGENWGLRKKIQVYCTIWIEKRSEYEPISAI